MTTSGRCRSLVHERRLQKRKLNKFQPIQQLIVMARLTTYESILNLSDERIFGSTLTFTL